MCGGFDEFVYVCLGLVSMIDEFMCSVGFDEFCLFREDALVCGVAPRTDEFVCVSGWCFGCWFR